MCWLLLLFASPSPAVPPKSAPPALEVSDLHAIRSLIEDQIAAFRRHDAEAAWRYVAPGLQERFVTPENFLEMVRTGYGPVYSPRSYHFGEIVPTPEGLGQWLEVVGPDGERVGALYLLERQPDGSWRSSGCLLTMPGPPPPEA
jgi:hypothetical protein